jgi:AcrR family transcriptional regulator
VHARSLDTQLAIRETALATFCRRGYRTTTLEEVGAQLGITRGTVLHHFRSKAELLAAVVAPYLRALDNLLLVARVDDPPTAGQRRWLLTEFADLFADHRSALRLLTNDVAARIELGINERWPIHRAQLVTLLVGSRETGLAEVRVAAAFGAIVAPVAGGWIDMDDPASHRELIDAAEAIINRPASVPMKIPAVPGGAFRRAADRPAKAVSS